MKIVVTGTPGSGKTYHVDYARKLRHKNFFDTDEIKTIFEMISKLVD